MDKRKEKSVIILTVITPSCATVEMGEKQILAE